MTDGPNDEEIEQVFSRETLLKDLKSKVPEGNGIAPEDMVELAFIIFKTGIKKGIEWQKLQSLI